MPVIDYECEGVGVRIRVGELPHPMEESHYIQFIEAISKNQKTIHREYLYPGEKPEINVNCRSNLGKKETGFVQENTAISMVLYISRRKTK